MKYVGIISSVILLLHLYSCNFKNPNDEKLKLVYSQDFESNNSLADFIFPEPEIWQIATDSTGNKYLMAKRQGSYAPPFRSPFLISLIDSLDVSDFVLEADLMQTKVEHKHEGDSCMFCMHRDMCVFWSFQDSTHFYYAHIARRGDNIAHQIHIVNDAPRTAITTDRTKGVDWDEGKWKHVKLVRSIKDTLVSVYFENMETPVLKARDNTFLSGRIGFGSFDEAGNVDNIKLYANPVKESYSRLFSKIN